MADNGVPNSLAATETPIAWVCLRINGDANACGVLKRMDSGPRMEPGLNPDPNPELGPVPPYDGNPVDQRRTRGHRTMEADDDELETTVTGVTVITTTNTMAARKEVR